MVRSLLAVALFAAPAAAAPTEEQDTVARVNTAIERGKNFLKAKYHPNNRWELFWLNALAPYDGGTTALATVAMLTAGERPDAEPVRSALEYLRSLPPSKTYVVALVTMALAEARRPADRTRIAANARWLIDRASRDNAGRIRGWSYPTSDSGSRPDGSNTQYALLGLYAAKQAGIDIEDSVWTQIRDLYTTTQRADGPTTGFWPYFPEKPDPSFTMTAAGVSGLVIAGMALNDDQQKLDPATGVAANCGRYAENDKLARGLNWLGRMFNWDGKPSDNGTWQYYNTYGIERVGRLSGQRFLGRIDWYRDGCARLVESQRPDGSWTRDGPGLGLDTSPVMATSFALLFLSKGRTPVLVSKLAHGEFVMAERGVLVEKGEAGGVVGWNRKHNDARNLTDFASRELFNGLPLGWQVYDPRRRPFERQEDILAEVGTLVQSPILYFNGHRRPVLNGQQKEIVKRYIEEGGFVLAEACCGSDDFAEGFRSLMEELFPDNVLKRMPPEHPVWKSFYAVPPAEFPKLECLERGCRTVVVFSPEPLAGYWEEARSMPKGKEPAATRGQQAYRLAGNVIAYATGMEPPKQKLSFTKIVDPTKEGKSPPGGFVKPAQLKLRDEPPPAPAAMRNLMGYLRDAARIDVVPDKESLSPADDDLFKYRFLYLHGRKAFSFDDAERANVKATLLGGGVLFADACCGSPAFDASFREMAAKMFPDKKLELIPDGDDLYGKALNGVEIRTVKRREKADGAGPDGGFKDLPPYLEGIKADGRWVVIYSKFDVGCALEGHKATDCLGHTRESALQLAAAAVLYSLKR
jgi:hypothetical protein